MEKLTLEAPDISCDHCIQSIRKAVEGVPGVKFISGDHERKTVTIEYNPDEAQPSGIAEAMEAEGYPVAK